MTCQVLDKIDTTDTIVLFCSVLFCSVLFCSVLFCSVLFCSVLFCGEAFAVFGSMTTLLFIAYAHKATTTQEKRQAFSSECKGP